MYQSTPDHDAAYERACQLWGNPARDEATLLWLYSSPVLIRKLYPLIDFAQHSVDFAALDRVDLSSGERVLSDLARVLFTGEGCMNVADLANALSDSYWQIAMRGLEIHRGR